MVLTDEELAKKVQEGDRDSFSLLVERYQEKMRRYGRKFLRQHEDIDDVVQDIFLKTYANIKSFDSGKKFSSWLYRIAHNTFLNHLRSSKKELFRIDFDTVLPFLYSNDDPEEGLELKKVSEQLDSYLELLDQKYREIIVLRFYEGLSYEEIADVLKVPVSTVGVRISRALQHLKKKAGESEIKQ
jgi:RNA polymerase sigma-70 factor (ECF subfamily)